jgi:F-type H+-transporting ATPase subunit gamma
MANNREIRRRIKSVKNTAQITKAMQMVAASKMRKAQMRATSGRSYAKLLDELAEHLHAQSKTVTHPLLVARPIKKQGVLVLSTDKGLCGGLNTNLFREILAKDRLENLYVTVGRKARQFVPRLKKSSWRPNLLADFELKDIFTYRESKRISQFLINKYLSREIDSVTIVYPRYVNALIQVPTMVNLLPIGRHTLTTLEKDSVPLTSDYLYEPSVESLLESLLPFIIHHAVYQLLLETRASEHSARMVAMKNATENAKGLVKELTLEYNKVRQAGITTELLEISTAQMAIS